MNKGKKILNWLFKTDHQINYYIFNGFKGETMSSRMGRHIERTGCMPCKLMCRIILAPLAWSLGQGTHHCTKSIQPQYRRPDDPNYTQENK